MTTDRIFGTLRLFKISLSLECDQLWRQHNLTIIYVIIMWIAKYSSLDNEKKRAYNQRVIEIEQGTFTPLVFGTNGAMAKECQIFHKLLAKKLSLKRNKKYCEIMSLIRTQISFSLLRSMLICIRVHEQYFKEFILIGRFGGFFISFLGSFSDILVSFPLTHNPFCN